MILSGFSPSLHYLGKLIDKVPLTKLQSSIKKIYLLMQKHFPFPLSRPKHVTSSGWGTSITGGRNLTIIISSSNVFLITPSETCAMAIKQKQRALFCDLLGKLFKPFSKNLSIHPSYATGRLNKKLKCQ